MKRRDLILTALSLPLVAAPAYAAVPDMEVLKSPTCGCCSAWINHIENAGFTTKAYDVSQEMLWDAKARAGITPELSSCHTAMIEGYVIEGHVPADDIKRMLSERPEALGLAVPGMPVGSPGMENADQRDSFDTLLVLSGGASVVFQSHA